MNNLNYAKKVIEQTSANLERVKNDDLDIKIAFNRPKFYQYSQDKPNFYSRAQFNDYVKDATVFDPAVSYTKGALIKSADGFSFYICIVDNSTPSATIPFDEFDTVNADWFTEKNMKDWELTLNLGDLDKKTGLKQFYLINNTGALLTVNPKKFAPGPLLKQIQELQYIRVYLKELDEVRYYWLNGFVINEGMTKSITFACTLDMWTTYYRQVIPNLQGDVKVLQRHYNRFNKTADGIIPNYNYTSPIHNIPTGLVNLPKNPVKISGLTRPQFADNTTANMRDNTVFTYNSFRKTGLVFSRYNSAGNQGSDWANSSNARPFLTLNTIPLDLTLDDPFVNWNIWNKDSTCFGPNTWNTGEKASDKFAYTFQYNVNETTPSTNVDETGGVQLFQTAQTNNAYTKSVVTNPAYISGTDTPFTDPKIVTYDRQIINRVGNLVNANIINEEDNLGNEETITGVDYSTPLTSNPNQEDWILQRTSMQGGVRIDMFYAKPYKTVFPVQIQSTSGDKPTIDGSIWYTGGIKVVKYLANARVRTFYSIPTYLVDFPNSIGSMKMEIDYVRVDNVKISYTISSSPATTRVGAQTTFNLSEYNKGNYNILQQKQDFRISEYNSFLNKVWEYTPNSNWDWTNEPQLYMGHVNTRIINYLGISKLVPMEIYGNDYEILLHQRVTPSTNIDTLIVKAEGERAQMTYANAGISTEYNNSLPSVSDSFQAYIQQNQAAINTSYLSAQRNMEFAKQQQTANIALGALGIVGAGSVGLATAIKNVPAIDAIPGNAGSAVFDNAANANFFREIITGGGGKITSESSKMAAMGGKNKIQQTINYQGRDLVPAQPGGLTLNPAQLDAGLVGVTASVLHLMKGILQGERNKWNAELQTRSIDAQVTDNYNTPDQLIAPSTNILEVQGYNERLNTLLNNDIEKDGLIRAVQITHLPTINTLKQYSMYANRYGYVVNEFELDKKLDDLLSRKRFNYVQLAEMETMIPNYISVNEQVRGYFMATFNEGVRLWDDFNNIFDYSKENWEIDLDE